MVHVLSHMAMQLGAITSVYTHRRKPLLYNLKAFSEDQLTGGGAVAPHHTVFVDVELVHSPDQPLLYA